MKRITVVMEGGVVQSIIGIPDDVVVVVRDYDLEDIDPGDYLATEELMVVDGNLCTEVRWGPGLDEIDPGRRATQEDVDQYMGA
jgi:hypothetical protein